MADWMLRTSLLLDKDELNKIKNAHVMVVGLGGVGSYAAEFIARAGTGKMTIIDGDVVEASNRNRQLPALVSTDGQAKAELMAARLLDINPELSLTVHRQYISEEFIKLCLSENRPDYVLDAIDTLTPKLGLIKATLEAGIPLVSSMGAGGKINPSKMHISDIQDTFHCYFAQQLRKRLKRIDIRTGFKAVFSEEFTDKTKVKEISGVLHKKSVLGTISYMPALFGSFCASVVLRDLTGIPYPLEKARIKSQKVKKKSKKKGK